MKKVFYISIILLIFFSCENSNTVSDNQYFVDTENSDNIFDFLSDDKIERSGVCYTYDKKNRKIQIQSNGALSNTVSGSVLVEMNGSLENFDYIFHSTKDCFISVAPNCTKQYTKYGNSALCCMQISFKINGELVQYRLNEKNFTIHMHKDEEVGIRFEVQKGFKGEMTFFPKVEVGTHSTINENDCIKYNNLKPIITFIDDDTSSVYCINRYYNALHKSGAVGNYAVITKNMQKNDGQKELLLSLEKKGFGCLYHCYEQNGNKQTSPGAYYLNNYRDMKLAQDNFVTGLKEMQAAGFSAFNYWVTPYGVDDDEMITLARSYGFNCLITIGQKGHISPVSCDRWHIPRWSLSPKEYNSQKLEYFKMLVDSAVADNGWIIVATHVNEWDKTTTMDDALSEAADYAMKAGMEVRNFPDAFEIYRPFFYMNEAK